MRFSIIAAVAAFSSTVLAQGLLDQIPTCAQTCFGGNLGTCGVADIACICSSKAIESVSCCVFATCSQSEIAATTQFAVQLCRLQNVEVNTQPTCPSGSAAPSGTALPSGIAAPSGSAVPSGNSTVTPTGTASIRPSGTAAPTSSSTAGSTAGASCQHAATALGLGMAMFGLLAAL